MKRTTIALAVTVAVVVVPGASVCFAGPRGGITVEASPSGVVAGRWSGDDWGAVVVAPDGSGSYTSTYGTGPGRFQLERVGEHAYVGTWRESSLRFGTLTVSIAPDGRTIAGTWTPDPQCTIGTMTGGLIVWTRR
jgi:hypothetical protein